VPKELIAYVMRLLRAEQALFVLAWFCDRPNVTRLGHSFGLSQATAYRYLTEGIAVLAVQTTDLHQALERAKALGLAHLILDGTTICCDRVRETKTSRKGKETDAWYSGKTHDFGGLIQALIAPDGVPLWISEVRPGSVHDITAARDLVLAVLTPYLKDLPVLAEGGYGWIRQRRPRGVHAGQEVQGRLRTRPRHAHVQPVAARATLPGRARLRTADPALDHPATRHAQPPPHRAHRTSGSGPDPIRAPHHHVTATEKTSACIANFTWVAH
jgi:hypothetical protein